MVPFSGSSEASVGGCQKISFERCQLVVLERKWPCFQLVYFVAVPGRLLLFGFAEGLILSCKCFMCKALPSPSNTTRPNYVDYDALELSLVAPYSLSERGGLSV